MYYVQVSIRRISVGLKHDQSIAHSKRAGSPRVQSRLKRHARLKDSRKERHEGDECREMENPRKYSRERTRRELSGISRWLLLARFGGPGVYKG